MTDTLIEFKHIYQLTEKSNLSIILRSNDNQAEIRDAYIKKRVVQLLRELTVNPFTQKIDEEYYKLTKKIKIVPRTGSGHTLPDRQKGGQPGKWDYSIKQRLARDMYLLYKRQYGSVYGAYNFIYNIFDVAMHPGASKDYVKKLIDLKSWPDEYKVIWREHDERTRLKANKGQ